MKLSTLAAQIIIYDDTQYLHFCLEPLLKYCDEVLILVNSHPFNKEANRQYDNSIMIEMLKALETKQPKIKVISGDWNTEEDERNYGLEVAKQRGHAYSLIVDTDEVYEDKHLFNLTQVLANNERENQGYWIFHANWLTYWKMNPLCVIDPPEEFSPVVCVRNNNAKFVHLRHVVPLVFGKTTNDNNLGRVNLPKELVTLHHFSYARSDAFIEKKCRESGHSQNGDLQRDWYQKVWLPWTLSDTNLHPINPPQYRKATIVNEDTLPQGMNFYFAKERGDL